ncbi:MAG TPA: hypothetical protein VHZ25_07695 [Acidobacteriaceae bacterium]|jgi:hypothetical protein|nr:hypothetical protein [Acidobacteriaceae bacterium]
MRYFQHKFTVLFAFLAFLIVYMAFQQFSFAIDGAICVGFTILVFGNALRQRGFALFTGSDARPPAETILAHAICLITLVLIVRMGMYLPAFLPEWFTIPIAADNYGRVGPSCFQFVQGIILFFMGYFEVRLLVAERRRDPQVEQARARTALWKKAGVEAERLSTLRLP